MSSLRSQFNALEVRRAAPFLNNYIFVCSKSALKFFLPIPITLYTYHAKHKQKQSCDIQSKDRKTPR